MTDLLRDPALWFLLFTVVLAFGIFTGVRGNAKRRQAKEEEVLRQGRERLARSQPPREDTIDDTSTRRLGDSKDEVTNTAVNEVTATAVSRRD